MIKLRYVNIKSKNVHYVFLTFVEKSVESVENI